MLSLKKGVIKSIDVFGTGILAQSGATFCNSIICADEYGLTPEALSRDIRFRRSVTTASVGLSLKILSYSVK